MTPPFISCICLTYGKTKLLREAVQCFLNQNYAGKRELVVLNSFPRQKIKGEFPNVHIVNLEKRPASLAACRNLAISIAHGSVISTFDDDDLFLPHHLTVIGEAFAESGADWVRLNPVFYAEGWGIKKTFNTWLNAVSFTKAAWNKCGRYPRDLSVGEDQAVWAKLSTEFKGITVELKPEEISAVYCWGTNTHHISGKGWDKPGQTPAYERSREELEARVQRGEEPIGNIDLKPGLEHDPVKMAKAFLSKPKPVIKKNSVCLVELGRYGDIVNILPIARHIAETYDTPHLMVSKQFASLLEGVSYVHSHPVEIQYDQLRVGIAQAEKEFKHVINCQVWGTGWHQERRTASFNRESWRMAGFGYKFDDFSPAWRPYFDRRDTTRETALATKLLAVGKPLLLVNVTHSKSSPFSYGNQLLGAIRDKFGTARTVVDCGSLHLERIYDMVGLMEKADALVSIDTALLHLCAATNIPTVALVNEKPWQGSECRGNCVARIPYNEATAEHVLGAIDRALSNAATPLATFPLETPPERLILHAVERHEERETKTRKRKETAWQSWDMLYQHGEVVPAHYWQYKRTAKAIGDVRELPYLKDCLQFAMDQARDDDIIMFTNDDNVLYPGIEDILRFHCSLWGAVCSQRCEFHGAAPKPGTNAAVVAEKGRMHMGRDLFAFTKRWLLDKWSEIPDMILGASDWDLMMCAMIRLQWGIETTRPNLEDNHWPCEMHRGYVGHQSHQALWCQKENVWTAPSQIHNRALFKCWATEHLPNLKFLQGNVI